MEDHNKLKRSVVIVGAGMAGLATARRLVNENSNIDVTVLEANAERYGGRIYSFEIPGHTGKPVDLGAMWIHKGTDTRNPLSNLCQRYGIKTIPHDVLHPGFIFPFDENGLPLSPSQFLGGMARLNQILDDKTSEYERVDMQDKTIMELFNEMEQENPSFMNLDHVKYLSKTSIESYNASAIDDLSAKFINGIPGYEECTFLNGSDTLIPGGYKMLLDRIISDGPPFKLILDRHVERISIDYNKCVVQIVCSDHTNQHYKYTANHVVIAVSIGVLKSKNIHFYPSLPIDQQRAIDRIGFGNMVKVIVVFDGEPFWPDGDTLLTESKKSIGWPLMFINMKKINGLNGLVALLASHAANLADSLPDVVVVQRVLDKLATIVGADQLKSHRLAYAKVTRWRNDALFRGTWSYAKIGMQTEDAFAIRRPISPFIFFAGEHTQFPEGETGTVDAAYMSGQRVAEEIMQLVKNQDRKIKYHDINLISHL